MIYENSGSTHHSNRSSRTPLKASVLVLLAIVFAVLSLALTGRAQAATGEPASPGISAFTPGASSAALTPLAEPSEEPAVTEQASVVTQTSATLNGTFDPNGAEATECRFEYGTSTTPYSSSVPCSQASLGKGTAPVPVSAPATALTMGTTYHFRLSAATALTASKGADLTFTTTTNLPPTVVTEAASSITQTTATLNATVNPNGGNVTACEFEYGTTPSYGKTVACSTLPGPGTSPISVSAALTGLIADASYYFRISATNAGGTSKDETGGEVFITPTNPPTVVLAAASEVTQTTATFNGTVNPNGETISSCKFEYGTMGTYKSSAPCVPSSLSGSSPIAVSAHVTGLAIDTAYVVRIVATSAGGKGEGLGQGLKTHPNPPTVVTTTASALAQTMATLNATVNPNGGEVTKCEFEYGITTSYGSTAACTSLPGSGSSPVAVSASLTGLAANTTYHFRIAATNAGGTSMGSDKALTTTPPPAPPAPPPSGSTGATGTTGPTSGLPAPVLGRTANVARAAGQVLLRLPGTRAFVTLSSPRQIPYGTVVEAAHGELSVTAATTTGGTQKGEFFDGEFVLTQGTNARVLATLTGGNFGVCPPAPGTAAAKRARAHSKYASRSHLVRRLWAEGHGNFATKGRYAGGIVKGAQWLTEDMCSGTLILATRERVEVSDLVRHRQVQIVSGGGIYLATPR